LISTVLAQPHMKSGVLLQNR